MNVGHRALVLSLYSQKREKRDIIGDRHWLLHLGRWKSPESLIAAVICCILAPFNKNARSQVNWSSLSIHGLLHCYLSCRQASDVLKEQIRVRHPRRAPRPGHGYGHVSTPAPPPGEGQQDKMRARTPALSLFFFFSLFILFLPRANSLLHLKGSPVFHLRPLEGTQPCSSLLPTLFLPISPASFPQPALSLSLSRSPSPSRVWLSLR